MQCEAELHQVYVVAKVAVGIVIVLLFIWLLATE